LVCIIALPGCSGSSSDTLPPLPAIEQATLKHANCVDQAARKLASQQALVESLIKQAVGSCEMLRAEALRLKAVPVIFPTAAEFAATHLGLARRTIEGIRARKP
jgi:hypothetical protein